MARKGHTKVIYKGTFVCKQTLYSNSTSTNFIPIALKYVIMEIVLVETVLMGDPLYSLSFCPNSHCIHKFATHLKKFSYDFWTGETLSSGLPIISSDFNGKESTLWALSFCLLTLYSAQEKVTANPAMFCMEFDNKALSSPFQQFSSNVLSFAPFG